MMHHVIDIILVGGILSCTKGQDLLGIKPEIFIEGEPGDVTCTYNNQFTTFLIYGSISNTQAITTCSLQSLGCVINENNNYSQYYSVSNTSNSVTIHINTINRQRDGGQWRCRAFVSQNDQQEETITIDVKVPVSSVEITNKNEDLIKDRTVKLECKSIGGYPLPNITWSINTRILMTSVNKATSSLLYQSVVSDQGQRLQCSATNGYGQSQTDSFQLDIKSSPFVPITFDVQPPKSTICVEWTPGFNGGASQSFIVQHSTDDKTWVNSSTIPDRTYNGRVDYCIEELEPDTSYHIRVTAINKYGESLADISSPIETSKQPPRQGLETSTQYNKGLNTGLTSECHNGDNSGYDNGYNSGFGAGIGTGLGIAVALVVIIITAVFIYRYWTGKRKKADKI